MSDLSSLMPSTFALTCAVAALRGRVFSMPEESREAFLLAFVEMSNALAMAELLDYLNERDVGFELHLRRV